MSWADVEQTTGEGADGIKFNSNNGPSIAGDATLKDYHLIKQINNVFTKTNNMEFTRHIA